MNTTTDTGCKRCAKASSGLCTKHSRERSAAARAEVAAIVAKGVCPCCGSGLHRNLALTGWWQCDRFGSPGFQKVAGPACSWQGFTS